MEVLERPIFHETGPGYLKWTFGRLASSTNQFPGSMWVFQASPTHQYFSSIGGTMWNLIYSPRNMSQLLVENQLFVEKRHLFSGPMPHLSHRKLVNMFVPQLVVLGHFDTRKATPLVLPMHGKWILFAASAPSGRSTDEAETLLMKGCGDRANGRCMARPCQFLFNFGMWCRSVLNLFRP